MSFTLTLAASEEAGIALVTAEGEATSADFPSSGYIHFDNILGPGWDTRFVLLDMDRVNYIDSSAIGWMLSAHKSFRVGGGKLIIHSTQPQIRQILELLKIDRVIPLAADLPAARAAMQNFIPAASTR